MQLFSCAQKTCRNTNVSSIFRCKTCPTVLQYHQGATKMVGGSPSAEGCVPPTTYEEGMPMMTLEGLIAVIGMAVTCFGLGYTIGSNNKTQK